jgi:serine/threonine protein kinase/Flp pilus assembly protein TadD
MVGQTISHYRIVREVGRGNMGVVFEAEDLRLGRHVALKLLPETLLTDRVALERFRREARAASALNHPNICTIYEINEAEGQALMAMELLEGQPLNQLIAARRLDIDTVLELGIQISDALDAAHSKGIIHRDIKPGNIFVTSRGLAKILDFGLAKLSPKGVDAIAGALTIDGVEEHLTSPGLVAGTTVYMSPEQVRGRELDARTDLFSFGTVLYEMATGTRPFRGDTSGLIFDSILNRSPVPALRISPEIPPKLDEVINKALEKSREVRYQSAAEVRADLKRLKRDLDFTKTAALSGFVPARKSRWPSPSIWFRVLAVVLLTALIAGGTFYFAHNKRSIDSIAVLPFVNTSGNPNTEYLSDGISEEVINSLSRLPQMRVLARSTVFRYKGHSDDPQKVGEDLGVRAVLTGRLVEHDNAVNLQAELVDVSTGSQLWGERYTHKMSDASKLQQEIASDISQNLRLRLTAEDRGKLAQSSTENGEAYQLYLKGRYLWNQQTEDGIRKSIELFRQTIDNDPNYALAYAGLADAYAAISEGYLPPREAMPKAKEAVTRALQLDSSLAEAHTALAFILFNYDWDWAGAEKEFKRAIEANPNYAEAHHQYGWFLALMGRTSEGITELKHAQQLDPLSPLIDVDLNAPYYWSRQYDRSIAVSRKVLDMAPNFFLAHYTLGWASIEKKDFSTAISELQKAKSLEDTPWITGALAYAYAVSGNRGGAQQLLSELQNAASRRWITPYWIAMIYLGLGDRDNTFRWLEKAYDERSQWLVWLKSDPIVDSIRSDPRFQDLVRRIGFPQ